MGSELCVGATCEGQTVLSRPSQQRHCGCIVPRYSQIQSTSPVGRQLHPRLPGTSQDCSTKRDEHYLMTVLIVQVHNMYETEGCATIIKKLVEILEMKRGDFRNSTMTDMEFVVLQVNFVK
jgi:hypothetical protein